MRTALIDADTIVYIAALNNQIEETEELHIPSAMQEIKEKLRFLAKETLTTELELHLTGSRNYRYEIYPEYKANRRGSNPPAGLAELKQEVVLTLNATMHQEIEADDYVVWAKNQNPLDYYLVAIDKDVLNSCNGSHYNYYFKDPKWVTVDLATASEWSLLQTVKGDPTDNIKGVPNYGDKKTEKFIASIRELEIVEKIHRIRDLFGNVEDTVLNYNLVSCHLFDGKKVNLAKSIDDIIALEYTKVSLLKANAELLTDTFM